MDYEHEILSLKNKLREKDNKIIIITKENKEEKDATKLLKN